MEKVVHGVGLVTDHDVYLFKEGRHFRLHEKLGAHVGEVGGRRGTHFAVWAPNARTVCVIGDFNGWNPESHPLAPRWDGSGIWEGFVPGVGAGSVYKYRVTGPGGFAADKGDPYGFRWEQPPGTGSVVHSLAHPWGDEAWMTGRAGRNTLDAPLSIYEVHLGSWRRGGERGERFLTYRELAEPLADYVGEMGFTHVELLPVAEHPFYGSWGYQVSGYFAPTARYGAPEDFMVLVDVLHQRGIGVILDWVPSHFPSDEHGLAYFDGTQLYEHADPRQGFQPEWKTYLFNYDRTEVPEFLISNALFWLDAYHVDGLRVDAVASMLYLDYGRAPGEWVPNRHGGRENLGAIEFLRALNRAVYERFPDVQVIAEESTAWPMVTRPVHVGGLGFGLKWNMGWMHDTLEYLSRDPVHRKHHHDQITFSIWYAFSENFLLPLSHDEVVHGKGSLLRRMPGDDWQRFANLRLLLGFQYAHPGKKLLFMGGELGQWSEWYHEVSLDWHLLEDPAHSGLQAWVRDLNRAYRDLPPLFERDFEAGGFQWVDCHDWEKSVVAFLRRGRGEGDWVLVVCNFTPVPRHGYRLGVPLGGVWREALNSDAASYGGSGAGNLGRVQTEEAPAQGRAHSLVLTLPPLGILFLTPQGRA
ncbi:MAG: 1,4-alpha-glucan branching protein GlgB [Deferrisomatales bacterium]|nr:1,4-alpha-glucan branching protein GlgB [Deferrisomatales bacterium]